MKAKVAALLIGLVLGSTGTAIAATQQGVWREVRNTYVCRGLDTWGSCRSRGWKPGYEVWVTQKSVEVYFGRHIIFACDHKDYPASCDDFR